MKTEDIPNMAPHDWFPERNQVVLAAVGKLGEEAAELASRCCRLMIQGLDELDPDDGRTNCMHLMDEIADVEALIATVQSVVEMNRVVMYNRVQAKKDFKMAWIKNLRRHFDWWIKA